MMALCIPDDLQAMVASKRNSLAWTGWETRFHGSGEVRSIPVSRAAVAPAESVRVRRVSATIARVSQEPNNRRSVQVKPQSKKGRTYGTAICKNPGCRKVFTKTGRLQEMCKAKSCRQWAFRERTKRMAEKRPTCTHELWCPKGPRREECIKCAKTRNRTVSVEVSAAA